MASARRLSSSSSSSQLSSEGCPRSNSAGNSAPAGPSLSRRWSLLRERERQGPQEVEELTKASYQSVLSVGGGLIERSSTVRAERSACSRDCLPPRYSSCIGPS